MSGIAAIIDWRGATLSADVVDTFTRSLPDNSTTHIQGPLAFSQQLNHSAPLSPLAAAPLLSACGQYLLICDARIDNRPELLQQLHTTPLSAQPTDAELILAAYRQWGQHCPAHLIGDFAFALWDREKRTLFAARDVMNMRTLSYTQVGDAIYIATDGSQLLQQRAVTAQLNRYALACWLSGWPDPHRSMFEGIELLPAAHSLLADANSIRIQRYWQLDPSFTIRHPTIGDYEAQLTAILTRNVSDRMGSTATTIATQMSGGMDSTSVTALAKQLTESTPQQLAVISHTYQKTASCDESDRIKEMQQHLDLPHIHYMAAEQHLALDFRELYAPTLDNPGTVCSPRYLDEMKLLKEIGADVLLTGSGGDEMTWGHSLTYSQRLRRGDLRAIQEAVSGCREMQLPLLNTLLHLFVTPLIPTPIKRGLRTALGRPASATLPSWMAEPARQMLMQNSNDTPDKNAPRFTNPALQARYQAWTNTSTINSVRSYHQAAAGFGIEVRHPFFDRRLLEFSFAIPDDLWLRHNYPKWLLRRSMTGRLPDSVCWNKKKIIFDGFFGQIIRDQHHTVRAILSDTRLQEMGLINNQQLLGVFESVVKNPASSLNVNLLYALMAQIWFQKYAAVFGQ